MPGPDTGRAPAPPCANTSDQGPAACPGPQHSPRVPPRPRGPGSPLAQLPSQETAHGGAELGWLPAWGTAGRRGGRRATRGLGVLSGAWPPAAVGQGPHCPAREGTVLPPSLAPGHPPWPGLPVPGGGPCGTGHTGRAGAMSSPGFPASSCPSGPLAPRPVSAPTCPPPAAPPTVLIVLGANSRWGCREGTPGDSPDLPQPCHLTGHTEDKPGRAQAKNCPRHTCQPQVPGHSGARHPGSRPGPGPRAVGGPGGRAPCTAPRPCPPVPPGTSAPPAQARGPWATAARPPHPELRERSV